MEMRVSPQQIVEKVVKETGSKPVTICSLHKPCTPKAACISIQQSEVFDFDAIERCWHRKMKCQSTSSVDAMTCTSSKLCMIELKGWKEFLSHQEIAGKEQITERENEVLSRRIGKQVKRYRLQNKLLDSLTICEEITGIEDLKSLLPTVYILVTDIDPDKDAASWFAQQLNVLANTATDWETVCATRTKEHFMEEMKSIKEISTAFILCKKFDFLLRTL